MVRIMSHCDRRIVNSWTLAACVLALLGSMAVAQDDGSLPESNPDRVWDDSTGVKGIVAFEFVEETWLIDNPDEVTVLLSDPDMTIIENAPWGLTHTRLKVRLDRAATTRVHRSMDVIEGMADVNFVPYNAAVHDKRIKIKPRRPEFPRPLAGSIVVGGGYDFDARTLELLPEFSLSDVVHELLHALGMKHEHQRSDRDNFVTVILNNIPLFKRYNYDKKNWIPTVHPYDLESIMHYGPRSASNKICLIPVSASFSDTMGQDEAVTTLDAIKLAATYGNPDRPALHSIDELRVNGLGRDAFVVGITELPADGQAHKIRITGSGFFSNVLDGKTLSVKADGTTVPTSPLASTTVLVNGVAVRSTTVISNTKLEATIEAINFEAAQVLVIRVSNPQKTETRQRSVYDPETSSFFPVMQTVGTAGGGNSDAISIQVDGGDIVSATYDAHTIYGPYSSSFGRAVVGSGDANGDGIDDHVVGLPEIDEVRCISGSDRSVLWQFENYHNEKSLGTSLAVIDDWTDDGVPEIVAGAPAIERVYVIDGATGERLKSISRTEDEGSQFGASIAACGDVTGNGSVDFLVGAPDHEGTGAVFLYEKFGDTYDLPEKLQISGSETDERFGHAVAGGLDVNGGGPDAVIGAPHNGTSSFDGRVYLYDLTTGTQIASESGSAYELLGTSVAMFPGLDGGPRAWFAAGAPASDVAGESGKVRVWKTTRQVGGSGHRTTSVSSVFTLMGEVSGDEADAAFGCALVVAGDVDEDGFDDLMVGAPGDAPYSRGYASVISGRTLEEIHRMEGDDEEESFGLAVAGSPGRDDRLPVLLVGSPRAKSPVAGMECGRIVRQELRYPPSRRKPMITEVRLHHPACVEITNFDTEARDVSDWRVQLLSNGNVYETPDLGITLQPGEIVVLTGADPISYSYAETPAHIRILDVLPTLSFVGQGFSVALARADGRVLDKVRVREGSVAVSSGAGLGGCFRGHAQTVSTIGVERVWGLDSNGGSDWTCTSTSSLGLENTSGGTPGHDPIPAYEVVINEIDTGSRDLVELRCPGSDDPTDLRHWFLLASGWQGQAHAEIRPWPGRDVVVVPLSREIFFVLGETTSPPSEMPSYVHYTNVRSLGQNFPFHDEELSCALYDHYGRLVDLVRATGHDDERAHNYPRAPAAWDAFVGAAAREDVASNTFGRDASGTDTDSGADWRAVSTRSMGVDNPSTSMTGSSGLGDVLDVRYHEAAGGGSTMIINAGEAAAGLNFSLAVSTSHGHGIGPFLGLPQSSYVSWSADVNSGHYAGTLDSDGSYRMDLSPGSLPLGLEIDAVFFIHDVGGGIVANTRVIEFDN